MFRLVCVACLLLAAGCREQRPAARGGPGAADSVVVCGDDVRRVVERFGARMKLVSLLAPDSVLVRSLRSAYAPFVTPALMKEWQANPRHAPGREVSNPWPARIAIESLVVDGGGCRVTGDVVYVETADTSSVLELRPLVLRLRQADGWRISAYESSRQQPLHGAAQVVQRYYAAIQQRDYRTAYLLWADSGRASGQTLEQFVAGFAQTDQAKVTIGDDVRVEGAAGSQYATVPVQVEAVLGNGQPQHFAGTYTLRRSLVGGAASEQRTWHIHSANVAPR